MANLSDNSIMINEVVFKAVLQRIEKETKARICQPQMIVGAPGSGKTFLLRRLFNAVSSLSGIEPVWIDGRTVFSNDSFVHHPSEKRCVLLVDDFHYYLKRTSNSEQFELRGILSKEDGPTLIATVPSMMPQLTNYEAAFFEGFRVYYLRPVSKEDLKSIINGTSSEIQRAEALMSYLPKTPLSVYTVCEIIRDSRSKEEDLIVLTQRMSPIFQAMFDSLSPQQQRILCALAGETGGIPLSGLRSKTGQKTGTISPYLTQMLERGLISKESKSTRSGLYRISDPLFDLWLPNTL